MHPQPPHQVPPGPPPPAWTPPPKQRRRWFWFGCLPVIVLVAVLVVVAVVIAVLNRGTGEIQRSPDGTVLPPSAPTAPVPDSAAVASSCTIQQGIVTRECAIVSPPGVGDGDRLPVVFLLHGFAEGPMDVRNQGDWAAAVVARRFHLVTPQGILGSWNAGSCCGFAANNHDDVSYLDALVDDISARPDVDPDRIFMAGFSNGGMMAYRYACVDDRVRAIASVAGTRVADCDPPRPIPILHVHGTGDTTVPYQGGAGPVAAFFGSSFAPVTASLPKIAAGNGCTGAPATADPADRVSTQVWDDCPGDATVELVTIRGWEHHWPLNGPYDATDGVLDFFGIS